ncbi:hypothetical protein ABEF93_008559 [Exophiala dermatitidis]
MAPSTRRKSQLQPQTLDPELAGPSTSKIGLHCAQCDNELGLFNNEWVRLTKSYVLAAKPGTHSGTEVGQKTQVVPNGALQQTVQGCTVVEVVCISCLATVGQFCKAVPTTEQEYLLGQYFYKLPKIYLKLGGTDKKVEPTFTPSADGSQPRSSMAPRTSRPSVAAASEPGLSQTPSRLIGTSSQVQPASEPQPHPSLHSEPRNGLVPTSNDESSLLEMRLRTYEERLASQSARLQQQDTQIHLLTSLVNSFRDSMEDMKASLRELRSRSGVLQTESLSRSSLVGATHAPGTGTTHAHSGSGEVEQLRAENARMKARLEGIASAMGVEIESPSPAVLDERPNESSRNILGKRKRFEINAASASIVSSTSAQKRRISTLPPAALRAGHSEEDRNDEAERTNTTVSDPFLQPKNLEARQPDDERQSLPSKDRVLKPHRGEINRLPTGGPKAFADLDPVPHSRSRFSVPETVEFSDDDLAVGLYPRKANNNANRGREQTQDNLGKVQHDAPLRAVPPKRPRGRPRKVAKEPTETNEQQSVAPICAVTKPVRSPGEADVEAENGKGVDHPEQDLPPAMHTPPLEGDGTGMTNGAKKAPSNSVPDTEDELASSAEQVIGTTPSATAGKADELETPSTSEASKTNRKQRMEEILRRDQLAKEAMELDD